MRLHRPCLGDFEILLFQLAGGAAQCDWFGLLHNGPARVFERQQTELSEPHRYIQAATESGGTSCIVGQYQEV